MKYILLILVIALPILGPLDTDCLAQQSVRHAARSEAQGALPEALLGEANSVFDSAQVVHYEHKHEPTRDQVRRLDDGEFSARTDCSGFVSFVLHKVAPKHYAEIRMLQPRHSYPQAKTYARFFSELDPSAPHEGWIGVARVHDLKPGDIIAWEKGTAQDQHHGRGNSGHVMIVLEPPGPGKEEVVEGSSIHLVGVHVIDSSSVYHFKPEEFPPLARQRHRDGLGKGYVRLVVNQEDRPIGYWEGTYWGEGDKNVTKPSFSRMIGFGRLVPMRD
jgi:hypothetical protein